MERFKENVADTDVYARVKLMPMPEVQREMALNTLRDAETIVNAFVWVVNAVKGLFGASRRMKAA